MAEATVAVLGTGTMGAPIARNLLQAGFDVRVWNRSRDRAEPLGDDGATVCETAADAVHGAAFVLTVLSDGDAVAATMDDAVLAALEDDAIWVQTSTVGIAAAERFAELAARHDVGYVDAPVLGTRAPAEQGELVVLASGPDDLVERCVPVFDAIGKETRRVGAAGAGSRLKLVVNAWLLAVTNAAAEAIALAEGLGLDPRTFLEAMEGSQIDTPYLHLKGEAILERRLRPSFALRLAEKDAGLVLAAAEQAGVDLAVARAAHAAFARADALGHGEEDMAAVYFATREGRPDEADTLERAEELEREGEELDRTRPHEA